MTTPERCPTDAVRPHRRQFVIGPRALLVRADWRSVSLGDSQVLSADPELRIGLATDPYGTRWVLLGTAVETRPDATDPLAELGKWPTGDVEELYRHWAGRWVLVGRDRLHPDAAAMLACYHGRDANGDLWASSSPVLILRAVGTDARAAGAGRRWVPPENSGQWGPSKGVSWYPPPHSGVPGVSRLLPSQILDLATGSLRPRPLVPDLAPVQEDDARTIGALGVALQTAILRLSALSQPEFPTLLLSGGRDSRVLLSMAAVSGQDFRTFTRIHRRATLADRLLPPKLAHIADVPHVAHAQLRELPGRRKAILEHAGYNLSWLSAEEFLGGGDDPLTGIALAGFGTELGRHRWGPDVPLAEATGQMIIDHVGENDSPALVEAFDAWLAWHREHPAANLSLDDCYYLEQRVAGRKGIKEQIGDLFRFQRFSPANCSHVFALIASLSDDVRRSGEWQSELIRSANPALLRDPFNPPDSYFALSHPALVGRRGAAHLSRGALARLRRLCAGPHANETRAGGPLVETG